jgi:predicted outer membrane repeat protein
MSSLPLRRLTVFLFSILVAVIALASIYSLTLARPQASVIVVNPGESIQAAIDAADPGDTILINAGTYTENLTLGKAVSLTGMSRTTTRIHGVPNQSVLTVSGSTISNSVVISGLTFANGGGFVVAFGGGIAVQGDAQPLIQHVAIDNNTATYNGKGGGIGSFSPLTLVDVEFLNNTAWDGGALYIYGDTVLTDCTFFNNLATSGSSVSGGGAIYAEGNLQVFNTDFISNSTARAGGGIYASGAVNLVGGRFVENRSMSPLASGGGVVAGSVTISGTKFLSNTAMSGGAIVAGDVVVNGSYFERNTAGGREGGAVRAYRSLILSDTTFISNTGVDYGGAVYVEQIMGVASVSGGQFINNQVTSGDPGLGLGGGLYSFHDIFITATNFASNTALHGGGLYAREAAVVTDSRFERNRSTSTLFSGGGGMTVRGALVLTGTEFIGNSAIHDGGGLYYYATGDTRIVNVLFADNTTTSDGAALFFYLTGGRVDLLHITIADDGLNPRQAIFAQNGSIGMTNTIIANHAIGIERWSGATVYEDYNLFSGNTQNLSGTISSGSHHPVGSPAFVDPAHHDYHLSFASAAVDVGVNAGVFTDLDGNPRPVKLGFDIGAYENQYTGPIHYVYLPLVRR